MYTAIATTSTSCACSAAPCACAGSTGATCVTDARPPRPRFFDGQLVTADDLNAMMAYLRTRDALLTRLVGGWGVLGGLRVNAGPGTLATQFTNNPLTPNPQILAGTTLTIGAGAAADAAGNVLTLPAPVIVDALQLAQRDPTTQQSRPCMSWFAGILVDQCTGATFSALDYLVAVVHRERPARPVPQLTGGGACDPASACDFSRALEDVEIRLIPTQSVDLGAYLITGCLDAVALPFKLGFDLNTGAVTFPAPSLQSSRCALLDALNEAVVGMCCARPAVVIGRVLLTASPGNLANSLPAAPMYTIVQDLFPVRRVIAPGALSCLVPAAEGQAAAGLAAGVAK